MGVGTAKTGRGERASAKATMRVCKVYKFCCVYKFYATVKKYVSWQ